MSTLSPVVDHQRKDRDHLLSQGHPQLDGGREATFLVHLEMQGCLLCWFSVQPHVYLFFKQMVLGKLVVEFKGSGIFLTFLFPRSYPVTLQFPFGILSLESTTGLSLVLNLTIHDYLEGSMESLIQSSLPTICPTFLSYGHLALTVSPEAPGVVVRHWLLESTRPYLENSYYKYVDRTKDRYGIKTHQIEIISREIEIIFRKTSENIGVRRNYF